MVSSTTVVLRTARPATSSTVQCGHSRLTRPLQPPQLPPPLQLQATGRKPGAGDGKRAAEGRALEERGCVRKTGAFRFEVEAESAAEGGEGTEGRSGIPQTYSVILLGGAECYADCDCPDHRLRCTPRCKHIHAALAAAEREDAEAKRADEFAAESLIESAKAAAEEAHRGCTGGCGGRRCTEAAAAAAIAASSSGRKSKEARRKRYEEIGRNAAYTAAVVALWYDSSGGGLYDLAGAAAAAAGAAAAASAGGATVPAIDAGAECPECHRTNIIKNGRRPNKNYVNQRYRCKDCGKSFSGNLGFERRKHEPAVVARALNMRFSGMSLRAISCTLAQDGVYVRYRTVLNWVEGCVGLAEPYVETLRPAVSPVWRVDELVFGVGPKGGLGCVVSILDAMTRYNLALQAVASKGTSDVVPLFKRAAALAGAVPTVLVSDMAANFHAAWKETYRARNFMHPPTFHVRHIHAGRADRNNNQMERFNRELRALERAARGVKAMHTSLFRGMRIHHNFVRPHMGLGSSGDGHDRLTPARAAKIIVEGRNVWITLVQHGRLHQMRGAAEAAAAAAAAAAASSAAAT